MADDATRIGSHQVRKSGPAMRAGGKARAGEPAANEHVDPVDVVLEPGQSRRTAGRPHLASSPGSIQATPAAEPAVQSGDVDADFYRRYQEKMRDPNYHPMADLYPAIVPRHPRPLGPSQHPVAPLTGERHNVGNIGRLFEDIPDVTVYPPMSVPADDRIIMDMRYILVGADRDNAELHRFLDGERSRTIEYWYNR